MYGQFVHAVTERYDGHFTPTGSTGALPAVHFWSFWNEPNFGQDLGPQAIDGSTKPIAPALYRSLLDAGYAALRQTQPDAHNTVLIGELAATGYALHTPGHPGKLPGVTAQTRALVFLRALYCVDDRYKPLQGSTATRYGCPATAAGARSFRSRNPALFDATGFADHPYSSRRAPNANPAKINRDYATFPVLNRVAKALDGVTGAYGSHKRFPIYNDEYGYITSPPQPAGLRYPTAAAGRGRAQPGRVPQLQEPARRVLRPVPAGRPADHRTASEARVLQRPVHRRPARPKATLVGLPTAALAAARRPSRRAPEIEIWGGARPAAFSPVGDPGDRADGRDPDAEGRSSGAWTTIQTVTVSGATGYFDIHTTLPYSGEPEARLHLPTDRAVPADERRRHDDLRPDRHRDRQRLIRTI